MILYQGLSQIDGTDIVAVLTATSENSKTGNVPQVWIMPADTPPHDAVKSGADKAVCGSCPLRPALAGPGEAVCYVLTVKGPLSVFKALQRGKYPVATPEMLRSALRFAVVVRIGAWGDPAAVPLAVWEGLRTAAPQATILGYTHQWRDADSGLRAYCMASTHSDEETRIARDAGWRVFRIIDASDATVTPKTGLAGGLFRCPSDKAWRRTAHVPCNVCRQCDGTGNGRTDGGRFIISHGIRRARGTS